MSTLAFHRMDSSGINRSMTHSSRYDEQAVRLREVEVNVYACVRACVRAFVRACVRSKDSGNMTSP